MASRVEQVHLPGEVPGEKSKPCERQARMSTWKASEPVLKNMAVALITYEICREAVCWVSRAIRGIAARNQV